MPIARATIGAAIFAMAWTSACGAPDASPAGIDGGALVDSSAKTDPAIGDGGDAGVTDSAVADSALPPDAADDHPPNPVHSGSPWTINSPDNKLVVEIAEKSANQGLSYSVVYDGKPVIDATSIGLDTSLADFSTGLAYQSGSTRVVQESYAIPTGKRSAYVNHANELTLVFNKAGREIDLVVRAYDDGGAYRFGVPEGGAITVNGETGGYALPKGTTGWAGEMAADYQGMWDARTESALNQGEYELPVLVRVPNANSSERWALLAEASVYSTYFGSHAGGSQTGDGLLTLVAGQGKVSVTTPFVTPWRVVLAGSSLSTIVESTIIESLNPPSEIADTSWIKPGRSAWSWWSGDSTEDYKTQTQYVDFAAAMGWEYYLCDEGWQASWMPTLVQYAKAKGVGIWLWIAGSNMDTDAKINANTSLWASWGVKGIKVDYVFGDSTTELAVYDKVARAAAKEHLMVNYHGCTKPSGERRRWPHLMTREAIYGAEQYKGGNGPTAQFNCIIPFTRNVVGPMDYTPVTYSDNDGKTTWAHQTALDIVFESGVQHLADKPASYQSSVAKDFLKAAPAAWDATKLIEGEPGSFVTIARRTGAEWYVGSICAGALRTAQIPLAFLDPGKYSAEIYRDGSSDTEQVREEVPVTSTTVLQIPLRKNGGCAIRIRPN